jgi:hypothetical protein
VLRQVLFLGRSRAWAGLVLGSLLLLVEVLRIYLLIQHTVSKWCSSEIVHKGCGGIDHWHQTEFQAHGDFLIQACPWAGRYSMFTSYLDELKLGVLQFKRSFLHIQ